MSNLLKQHYVMPAPSDKVRVINSNEVIEEKLARLTKELQRAKMAEAGEGGFTEGLFAEPVEVVPELTPEEIIEQANAEAKEILDAARLQADNMLNDAHRKGLEHFEEQKRNGYAAGEEELRAQLAAEKERFLAELEAKRQEYENAYHEQLSEMENDVMDALIQVFDHVFHIQFEDKKEILVALATNVLMNVDAGKNFRIHVAPDNVDIMRGHAGDFSEIVGNGAVVEIVRDNRLEGMQCKIESEYGLFDCGLDTEYKNLIKDIRSLCR